MSFARWSRLHDDLTAAGFGAHLSERPFTDELHGRVRHGVSRFVSIASGTRDGFRLVEVHDKFSGPNETWAGWQVHVEGADSIVVAQFPLSSNRRVVVAHVAEAMRVRLR